MVVADGGLRGEGRSARPFRLLPRRRPAHPRREPHDQPSQLIRIVALVILKTDDIVRHHLIAELANRAIIAHTHPSIFQVCVVNTKPVPEALLERYRQEHAEPVEPDVDAVRKLGYQVVADDVVGLEDYVRHNSDKLARLIVGLSTGMRRAPPAQKANRPGAAALPPQASVSNDHASEV